MKLIHCADLHLDSAMTKHFGEETGALRRKELLLEFERMVDYAKKQDVKGILIAGDLFDADVVSRTTAEIVRGVIADVPEIAFFYLKGNHDTNDVLAKEPIPKNLYLFSDGPQTYEFHGVSITGIEGEVGELSLSGDGCQIVMLHGMDGKEFSLLKLQDAGIDYLALGHLHSYRQEALGSRGIYCYPGCLAGRGFDESGEKGFVLLDVEGKQVQATFVPFALRNVQVLDVDVSDCYTSREVFTKLEEVLAPIPDRDLVRVQLCGRVDPLSERNLSYLTMRFAPKFYVFQIKDKTELAMDLEELSHDRTIRGEFLRLVMEQEWNEERKRAVCELGMKALMGDEL